MNEKNVHPEVLSWAQSHGSERVKKGLEAGYSMVPTVYFEWAKVHYPGFVLDLDNKARWKAAKCPSLKALQIEEQYRGRPHVKAVFTVDATWWPAKYEGDEVEYASDAECVVVRDERVPYDLVLHVYWLSERFPISFS